jgi:SAM-dependent methyltransferase
MESAGCDICGSNVFDVVRMERFTDFVSAQWHPVLTNLCRRCGHVFMNPRMTDAELSDFYRTQLRESFEVARGEQNGLFAVEMERIAEVFGAGNGRRALEVGCYTGYMLKRLSDSGWDAVGLEPNEASAERAREKFGLPVHTCTFDNFSLPADERFDLIVMGSILEHVNRPTAFLMHAHSMLVAGGGLFVRVPDVEELSLPTIADLFPIEHPNMFSATILERLFLQTGFEVAFIGRDTRFPRCLMAAAVKTAKVGSPCRGTLRSNYHRMSVLLKKYENAVERERARVSAALRPLYVPEPRLVVIYGAGSHTEFLLRYTDVSRADIRFLVDGNPKKWGERFLGFLIEAPERLMQCGAEDVGAVIVSSRAFQAEIHQKLLPLAERGIEIVKLYEDDARRM